LRPPLELPLAAKFAFTLFAGDKREQAISEIARRSRVAVAEDFQAAPRP
jgi:hypothetical protein